MHTILSIPARSRGQLLVLATDGYDLRDLAAIHRALGDWLADQGVPATTTPAAAALPARVGPENAPQRPTWEQLKAQGEAFQASLSRPGVAASEIVCPACQAQNPLTASGCQRCGGTLPGAKLGQETASQPAKPGAIQFIAFLDGHFQNVEWVRALGPKVGVRPVGGLEGDCRYIDLEAVHASYRDTVRGLQSSDPGGKIELEFEGGDAVPQPEEGKPHVAESPQAEIP